MSALIVRSDLLRTAHRPWPVPARPWTMAQVWRNLLFAHWPVPSELLRPLLPPALEIDRYEGQAWLGIVPFLMTGVRPRLAPALPWISHTLELNVRTYVKHEGKPGVWFFSLDAARLPIVLGARLLYVLPYFWSQMSMVKELEAFRYSSRRRPRFGPAADFEAVYRPDAPAAEPVDGSLEHFLTERYCLYADAGRGRLWRVEIHHDPWPLQPASAELPVVSMTAPLGIELPATQPLLHFSLCQEALVWSPERCGNARP